MRVTSKKITFSYSDHSQTNQVITDSVAVANSGIITKPIRFRIGPFWRTDGLLFDSLQVTLPRGQTTCLLGRSGSGKTTLLRLIAGLEHANHNQQTTTSHTLAKPVESNAGGLIAYMAQQDLLLPWLSIIENVLIGFRLRGETVTEISSDLNASPKNKIQQAQALLDRVGLGAVMDWRPDKLSGGMRQRVALVRTLLEDRSIILMDEPFSALDTITRLDLQNLAHIMLQGRTVLLVTHDPLEALRLGDHLWVLSGHPASLVEIEPPSGAPLRDLDDPDLVMVQTRLIAQLRDDFSAASSIFVPSQA